ncbi:hypothetical protein RFI_03728 [Reticulomyxa filosa]|uniref:Uncharacterized protein n=1 Tax=Reticulomyxa filosa TaxID=46433 RepID=X6P6Y7_RETFI|nr:hypothetical protein RFI_03728 [Reticulomyxa filosa]|eukprot:ETO33377.1 hypothetical protein RFI_03728 [Reticulomyxa filosa]
MYHQSNQVIQKELRILDNNGLIRDRLNVLNYLCVSTETLSIVIQCYKQYFKISWYLFCKIFGKLNEKQLDDVLEFLMNGLSDKGEDSMCAELLTEMALNLNERQLNKVLKFLMNAFDDGKIKIYDKYTHTLAMISLQLGGKQLDNVFQYLINKCHTYFYYKYNTQFIMKLKEEQLDYVFKCWINGLSDNKYIRSICAGLLGELSMKWNEKQLNDTFNSLIDRLNDENEDIWVCRECARSLGTIAVKLNEQQIHDTFNHLINGFQNKKAYIYGHLLETIITMKIFVISVQNLLEIFITKLNERYLTDAFQHLINGLKYENKYVRSSCVETLGDISVKLDEKQLEEVFNAFIEHLAIYEASYYYALAKISVKLNDKQLYLLMKRLLEKGKKNLWYINIVLKGMSEDMWKRVTICALKENTPLKMINKKKHKVVNDNSIWKNLFGNKKNTRKEITAENTQIKINENKEMELFAFGLLTYNPRIQLNCNDDNITLDALNELTNYCNKQASEWGYSYH